jgi:hypothetical protein
MTIMARHGSATTREETPQLTETNPNQTNSTQTHLADTGSTETTRTDENHPQPNDTTPISNSLLRRAESIINDRSIDGQTRAAIQLALEIKGPWFSELVRRAEAGVLDLDAIDFSRTPEIDDDDATEEKVEALAEIICRAGDEPETKSAALLVLMAMLEDSVDPRALANAAKHFAFTRCGELNSFGIVDTQVAAIEDELLAFI